MTDNEIIKALECLAGKDVYCSKCAYNGMSHCREKVGENALNLINRQKAEIEKLREEVKMSSWRFVLPGERFD